MKKKKKQRRLQKTVYKEKRIWSSVTANFSNVLSVVITNDIYDKHEVKTLNFDLTTGKEISFENLFVSSAPIKSMIATGVYKDFAWNKLEENYEKYEGLYDMKDADTSEIEEESILATKKYEKIKDEIIFSFSPTYIAIHNSELRTTIDMLEYANEIAIYKRYLTGECIYENDDLGTKGTIVFTEDISRFDDYAKNISYGKITNNIFVEEVLFKYADSIQEEMNTIVNYVNKLSEERKTILKQDSPSNKGVIFQGEYHIYKDEDKGYYYIHASYYKAECSLSYFEDEAFRDYIEVKGQERAEEVESKVWE